MRKLPLVVVLTLIAAVFIGLAPREASAQCYLCAVVIQSPVAVVNAGNGDTEAAAVATPMTTERCDDVSGFGQGVTGFTSCTAPNGVCSTSGSKCDAEEISVTGTGFYPTTAAYLAVLSVSRRVSLSPRSSVWIGCKGTVVKREYSSTEAARLRAKTFVITA